MEREINEKRNELNYKTMIIISFIFVFSQVMLSGFFYTETYLIKLKI